MDECGPFKEEELMNIKFRGDVQISPDTFKISLQDLQNFLEELRRDLQTKMDFLISSKTTLLCKKDTNEMDVDVKKELLLTAAEKILPHLEQKIRRFSISNSGLSFSKSIDFVVDE